MRASKQQQNILSELYVQSAEYIQVTLPYSTYETYICFQYKLATEILFSLIS